jgi:hypothetical protein
VRFPSTRDVLHVAYRRRDAIDRLIRRIERRILGQAGR